MVLAYLDAEHVRDDLLRLAVELRVDERRVVVARDTVACGLGFGLGFGFGFGFGSGFGLGVG